MSDRSVDISFSANVVPGVQRGRTLGFPTLNLDLDEVPAELDHGIYACFATLEVEEGRQQAVMHYGPRPVFKDTISCEVFVLDRNIQNPPSTVNIEVRERIRDVTDFPLQEVLQDQIEADIAVARAILRPS